MKIWKNKRGEELVYPIVIFIILNIVFFSLLITFSYNASKGALVYEEVYAKEIALILDSMEPGMNVNVSFEEPYAVAKSNSKIKDLVKINKDTHSVEVSLSSSGGYSKKYFSSYAFTLMEDFSSNKKNIIISIRENENEQINNG